MAKWTPKQNIHNPIYDGGRSAVEILELDRPKVDDTYLKNLVGKQAEPKLKQTGWVEKK